MGSDGPQIAPMLDLEWSPDKKKARAPQVLIGRDSMFHDFRVHGYIVDTNLELRACVAFHHTFQ